MNQQEIKMEQEWRVKLPTMIERIRIFGQGVLLDLREKESSLVQEITGMQQQIEMKQILLNHRILSVAGFEDDSNNAPDLIFLKNNEKWFGEEIIEHLFVSEIKEKQAELSRIRQAITIIDGRGGKRTKNRITSSDIEKAKLFPVEELAEAYTKLRKSGVNKYLGRCPFHSDKNPSFIVYCDSNRYKCFGCQENGDVISFVMKIKKLSFIKAVKVLLRLQKEY